MSKRTNKKKKIKEKVEKVLSTCLEAGMSEQEAIVTVKQSLAHSYSVKLVRRHRYEGMDGCSAKKTEFYSRMLKARIGGTPRLNGEVMK